MSYAGEQKSSARLVGGGASYAQQHYQVAGGGGSGERERGVSGGGGGSGSDKARDSGAADEGGGEGGGEGTLLPGHLPVSSFIGHLERLLDISKKDILSAELPVFSKLSFSLHVEVRIHVYTIYYNT